MVASQCSHLHFGDQTEDGKQQFESDEERKKREEIASFVIAKLFPLTVVKQLIQIIFMEMRRSLCRINGLLRSHNSKKPLSQLLYESRVRTLESTKKFLSIYIAN